MKDYRTMTEQERTDWSVRFAAFLEQDYANIKTQGDGWKDSFRRGLKLLQPLTIAEEFVRTSKEFMDYERRIDRMAFFVEEMRRQVIEVDGDILARMSVQTKRRVGRPTKEEVREYAKQEQEEQSGKVEALARIAGMALPATEKKNKENKENEKTDVVVADLFTPNPSSHSDVSSPSQNEASPKPRLQDIKHLLDADLQDAVDTIAMLRSRAATESELAKELVAKGSTREEIEKHAKAACECTNAYEDIYARVDHALAQLYVNTKKSDKYIKYGETRESQMAKTEPYYQKVSKVQVVQESKDEPNEPNEANGENQDENQNLDGGTAEHGEEKKEQPVMSKADKAALLHKYRTSFMRKDVKITKQRVNRMKQIIAELKKLGVPTDEYEVVMAAAEKQLNQDDH